MWPQLSAVAPTPNLGGVPIAIIVPKGEEALLELVNAVVDVDLANGLFKEKLDYWVRGHGAQVKRAPRWSLGRQRLRVVEGLTGDDRVTRPISACS